MSSWRYFFGAAILGGGLLLKAGVPIVPLAFGLALAAFVTWKKSRSSSTLR
jgi:hypothetical protein